jgi:hypothetical protein
MAGPVEDHLTAQSWHFLRRFNQRRVFQMEYTKNEVAVVEKTAAEATDAQLRELNELQLAFVGGGVGEVTLS